MRSTTALTDELDSTRAGEELGRQIRAAFDGESPDAVIVFASARYDYSALLRALTETCSPGVLVGSSSAGEFTSGGQGEGQTCALALRSPQMQFSASVGRVVSADRAEAARQVVASFRGATPDGPPFRSALVMADALAGYLDDLIEQLTLATSGMYQFFGGGAGDDARFQKTHVFCGTEVFTDAVVALEILSYKPLGVGVSHGWRPASAPMRVTEADGMRLVSLNGVPAADAFADHAEETGQSFNRAEPLPFFLHNILGIETEGGYKLRVPLAVGDDGSVTCAAEIAAGATVHIMKTTAASAAEAAAEATRAALRALNGGTPRAALFFDCVATRLRMGDLFGLEMDALAEALRPASFAGCNTYGQIARAAGQFSGFHNCTAVVCIFPE